MRPCQHCVEINSVRPPASTPMCCLIRTELIESRSDGNTACALCFATGSFTCSAGSVNRPARNASLRRSASTTSSKKGVASSASSLRASFSSRGKGIATAIGSELSETMATFDQESQSTLSHGCSGYKKRQQDSTLTRDHSSCPSGTVENCSSLGHGYTKQSRSRKSVEFAETDLEKGSDASYQRRASVQEPPMPSTSSISEGSSSHRPGLRKRTSSLSSALIHGNKVHLPEDTPTVVALIKRVEALEASTKFQSSYILRLEKDLDEHQSFLGSLRRRADAQNDLLMELQAERVHYRAMTVDKLERKKKEKKKAPLPSSSAKADSTKIEREKDRADDSAHQQSDERGVMVVQKAAVTSNSEEDTTKSLASILNAFNDDDDEDEDDEESRYDEDQDQAMTPNLDVMIQWVEEGEKKQRKQKKIMCLEQLQQEARDARRRSSKGSARCGV